MLLLLALYSARGSGQSSEIPPPAEPEMISVFPPGAAPDTKIEVEIRGRTLDGANVIWAEDGSLKAQISKVEEIRTGQEGRGPAANPESPGIQKATALIEVDSHAQIGAHRFRLVSPRGVSNALTFQVFSVPIVADTSVPHNTPEQAQSVRLSGVINGRINKSGELNYYVFEARKGEKVRFELEGGGQVLEVFERNGSWFDPERIEQLEPEKAPPCGPSFSDCHSVPSWIYQFARRDTYLARVRGEPDSSYQLRMIPVAETPSALPSQYTLRAASANSGWRERDFTRKLSTDRLQVLWSRTLATAPLDLEAAGGGPNTSRSETSAAMSDPLSVVAEREPNETPDKALEIPVPVILEGAIDRPGDVDSFKFKVKPGDRLAFEIETPVVTSPYFNPLVRVLDAQGQEVMTNIYKRIPVQSMEYWGTVEPKTIHTFKEGGQYFFQIRDITLQHGEPGFRYRVLIRPQIPHIGEVQVAEVVQHAANDSDILADRVSLVRGYSQKLTVTTEREEGFSGEIAVVLDNLPPGVEVFPATELEEEQVAPRDEGLKRRFRPEIEQVVILLIAKEDAPVTAIPQLVRVSVRPIVPGRVSRWYKTGLSDSVVRVVTQGKIGAALQVQSLPLMVVNPPEGIPTGTRVAQQSKQPIPEKQAIR